MGVGTLALFAVVAGTAGWTVAYTGNISPSSITTKTIFLKDSAGKERLRLSGNNGSVRAFDSAGRTRVRISGTHGYISAFDDSRVRVRINPVGIGRVRIWGANGDERIVIRGSAAGGSLRLKDSAGRDRVVLDAQRGSLYVKNSAGKTRVAISGSNGTVSAYDSARNPARRIRLNGSNGSIRLSRPNGKNGIVLESGGDIRTSDETGKTRFMLDGDKGDVKTFDRAGKQRFWIIGGKGDVQAYNSAGNRRLRLDGANGKIYFSAPNKATISHP